MTEHEAGDSVSHDDIAGKKLDVWLLHFSEALACVQSWGVREGFLSPSSEAVVRESFAFMENLEISRLRSMAPTADGDNATWNLGAKTAASNRLEYVGEGEPYQIPIVPPHIFVVKRGALGEYMNAKGVPERVALAEEIMRELTDEERGCVMGQFCRWCWRKVGPDDVCRCHDDR